MNRTETVASLRDIHAITIAPFDANDAIDTAAVEANVTHLIDGGMRVIVAAGNTGEYHALAPEERRDIVEQTAKITADADAVLIVGVGSDIPSAVAAARHAADQGAAAVMVHHPGHPHASSDGFIRYHELVAAGSPVPVIPYMSKPVLRSDMVPRLLDACDPIAVKFAINDPVTFAAFVAADTENRTVWIAGSAERWAPSLWWAGAEGFTSGVVNVSTVLSRQLLAALRDGDVERVREIWRRLEPFEALRAMDDNAYNVAVVKEGMRQMGMTVGHVRPPATEVREPDRRIIAGIIEDWMGHEHDSG